MRALLVLALIGCGGSRPAPPPAPAPLPRLGSPPAQPRPPGRSCEHHGDHIPDGATTVEDIYCKTCVCRDGLVTECTRSVCDAPIVERLEFDKDDDTLDTHADATLEVIARIFTERPELVAVALGSGSADEADAPALSVRRGRAVVAALVARGIAAHRLVAAGRGYHGNASHTRRVELVVAATATPETLGPLLGAQRGPHRCHTAAVKRDPFLSVDRAEITVTLTPGGTIEDLTVSDLGEPVLEACLATTLEGALWPPVTERTTVAFALPLG